MEFAAIKYEDEDTNDLFMMSLLMIVIYSASS